VADAVNASTGMVNKISVKKQNSEATPKRLRGLVFI
jgi:hypothetical protein